MKYDSLQNEQKLILLASRLTFAPQDEIELEELKTQKLDWYKIVEMALKNKVLPLLWRNLQIRGFEKNDIIPYRLQQVLHFHYLGTNLRNNHYFEEMNKVLTKMNDAGVTCIPLKGAELLPNIYKDFGVRTVNDVDFLISKADISKIRTIMNHEEFYEGEYNSDENAIVKPHREKIILWKTQMNSLHPFKKISNSDYIRYYEFDFSFSLDFDLRIEPVNEMISRATKNDIVYKLKPCDFFIHQCCHHYKEATNVAWVLFNSDINLIKFCDVREFILKEMNESEFECAIEFAIKHNLEKAVYFTLFYLKLIYNDSYEEPLMERLNIIDTTFLDQFGERDYDSPTIWKKDYWQRMFLNNLDEVVEKPKFDGFVDFKS